MRQSLIRVLQSPTRTTVSHYLQIHLGPGPGQIQAWPWFTNGNQWPNTQPCLMYSSVRRAKYRKPPWVGCTALCMRIWTQPSFRVIRCKCGFNHGFQILKKWCLYLWSKPYFNLNTIWIFKHLCTHITSCIYLSERGPKTVPSIMKWETHCCSMVTLVSFVFLEVLCYSWCQGFVLDHVLCNFNVWSRVHFCGGIVVRGGHSWRKQQGLWV